MAIILWRNHPAISQYHPRLMVAWHLCVAKILQQHPTPPAQ